MIKMTLKNETGKFKLKVKGFATDLGEMDWYDEKMILEISDGKTIELDHEKIEELNDAYQGGSNFYEFEIFSELTPEELCHLLEFFGHLSLVGTAKY